MPAQSTYTLISSFTASGSTGALTFGSIPQTYTDLVLVGYHRSSQAANNPGYYVRPNTNTGWTGTYIAADGSNVPSGRFTLNTSDCPVGNTVGNSATAGIFGSSITHFMNYSNTTTFKVFHTLSTSDRNGGGFSMGYINHTNGTAAITTIVIYNDANSNWVAGSTWQLYGITAA